MDEPIHPVNIPRREKDFQGMLEYNKEDELKLVKNLILGKISSKSFVTATFTVYTGWKSKSHLWEMKLCVDSINLSPHVLL